MVASERLFIFDTTLRDGEQSPGAAMNKDEKLRIAQALDLLRVDIIEAGFPAASHGDFDAVKAVANLVEHATVCGLARANDKDIDACGEALKGAKQGRIHTFIATSPIHMEKKLKMKPDDVVERAVKAVKRARQYTDDVEFSPEDAGRSDHDFLVRVLEAVVEAGARTLNIPDTVGYNLPNQYGDRIRTLIESIPNADKAIFSTHCHNDLGLAVANSLQGVIAGARQVECTINGIGERAGNASLEEIVMAVRTRQDLFPCDSNIEATKLYETSRLVSRITGFHVPPNKAIVGANAFAHESGIHQDGVLKARETYEIMRSEDVGWHASHIVLGKLSGRNAFQDRMVQLGVRFESDDDLAKAFDAFKDLADKKRKITDDDLLSIIYESHRAAKTLPFELLNYEVDIKSGEPARARVLLRQDGNEKQGEASGNGPVDAVFKAIEAVTDIDVALDRLMVSSRSEGQDAQGEVNVTLRRESQVAHGRGSDTDIVLASAKAYVDALNLIILRPIDAR